MTAKSKESPSATSKSSDKSNSTKKVGGGTKSHPVTAERLKAAEDVIKKKVANTDTKVDKATEELKKRAHAAKKRAQDKILEKGFVSDPTHPFERLADNMDTRARRWEVVVYPTLFAFILLACFGFYLIYHLTRDISILSKSMTEMSAVVSSTMPDMKADLQDMSNQMTALRPMNANLANMTQTMGSMNRSVYGMQRDVGNMNQTVSSGPFGMMNDMLPFSSNSYRPGMMPPVYGPPVIAPPIKRAPSVKNKSTASPNSTPTMKKQ